jgi:hypothetical protein
MRMILLALMALAFTVPTAEASRREESRQVANRPAQQPKAAPAMHRNAAPAAAARPLQRGDVRTQRDGIVVRGASAATVSRNAAPQPTRRLATPVRSGVAGWQNGLPRADYAQRECPEGTFATLARGHDDVVRCMPF